MTDRMDDRERRWYEDISALREDLEEAEREGDRATARLLRRIAAEHHHISIPPKRARYG